MTLLSPPIRQWHMLGWQKNLKNLDTVRLYGDRYVVLNNKIALDRCPHRGASLSKGKVIDGCVSCPYHGRQFSETTHPEMFSGVIKDGAIWIGGESEDQIPRIPEFDDPSYRSILMTRRLKNANAVAFSESSSDFEHVRAVHSMKIADLIPPTVSIDSDANKNVHVFETPKISLRIETYFWLPFSNCLKFYVVDKKRNKVFEPFILFFSTTPHDDKDMTLHIRSMRKKLNVDLDFFLDLFFIAVSDLPVFEDYNVVKGVDVKRMMYDQLTPEDDFIKLYREKMLQECPQVLNYFIT